MKNALWSPAIVRQVPLLFVIFYVLYSYEINNFDLSLDDERHAFSDGDFIPLGRWLIPAIKYTLWPQLVVPHAPYLIFGLLISLAYCVTLGLARVEKLELFHYACFGVLVSFPVVAAQLEFSAHIIALGISFLAAAVAVFFTIDAQSHAGIRYWARMLYAVLLCSMAAGAYQSAILNYVVILLPLIAQKSLLQDKADYRGAFGLAAIGLAVLVVATLLYSLISWSLIELTGMPAAKEYLASSYLGEHPSLFEFIYDRIFYFLQAMYRVFYAMWYNYGLAKYVFAFSILFCVATVLAPFLRSPLRLLLLAAALTATLMAPGALILVSGQQMPIRVFVAASTALMMLFLLAYQRADSPLVRNAITVLTVLFVTQSMYILSAQRAATWVTQRHDVLMAGALNRDILAAVDTPAHQEIRVDFHGSATTQSVIPGIATTMSPASFFAWDYGNPFRMVKFMNLMGFHRYESIPDSERARLKPEYADAAIWPHPGSIKVVDGVVLVRLSE